MQTTQDRAARASVDIVHVQDCIVVYRALDAALCRTVVELFDRDESKSRGKILDTAGDVAYAEEAKRSWDLEIPRDGIWRAVFEQIHPKIETCIAHYLAGSPALRPLALQATGYKIQMYPRMQGYFRWHADSLGNDARVAAMVLYLNDVTKGGETEFFHQQIKVTPRAGHLVLFPTGWSYLHCGRTPESGDKYVISSFVRIKG